MVSMYMYIDGNLYLLNYENIYLYVSFPMFTIFVFVQFLFTICSSVVNVVFQFSYLKAKAQTGRPRPIGLNLPLA